MFLVEPGQVDSMIYFTAAQDPFSSDPNHWTTRIGLVLPVAAVASVFGFSEVAFYIIPVVFGVLFGSATAWVGWMIAGRPGLLAGPIAATSPLILPFGSQLLPDVAAAGIATFAIALTIHSSTKEHPSDVKLAALAGAAMGFAYLVREIALVFFLPQLAVAWLFRVRSKAWYVALVGGAAGVAVLELIAGWFLWGDPLARLSVLTTYGGDRILDEIGPAGGTARDLWASAIVLPRLLWASSSGKLLVLLVTAGVFVPAWRRSRLVRASLIWTFSIWAAYTVLGTLGVLRLLDRYWGVVVPFLVLAALATPALGLRGSSPWISVAGVSMAALPLIALGIQDSIDRRFDAFLRFEDDGYWQLRDAMADLPAGTILHVPGRVADVTRIYTFDPFGRRVTDVTLLPDAPGRVQEGNWLLIHEDANRLVPGGAEDTVAPPPDYELFAVDMEGPSWVLLSPGEGSGAHLIARVEDDGWAGRHVAGGQWGPIVELPQGAVLVPSEDLLVAFNGLSPPESPDPTSAVVSGLDLVEVRIRVEATEGRPFQIACNFYRDGLEQRVGVPALAMVTIGPYSGNLVGYCWPPDREGQYTVRPYLVFFGGTSVDLSEASLRTYRMAEPVP